MYILVGLLLLSQFTVHTRQAKFTGIIHGDKDLPLADKEIFVIDSDGDTDPPHYGIRHKRSIISSVNDSTIIRKINYLNVNQRQLLTSFMSKDNNIGIILGREHLYRPSSVFISYDYGDTYVNKTDKFKLTDGSIATLRWFYVHPQNNTHIVFVDVHHKVLFTTENHGKAIKRKELNFTPSEVAFSKLIPATFVILDKNDPSRKLWVTEDFGNSFRQVQEFVKAFQWIENETEETLLVRRVQPNGNSSILYFSDFLSDGLNKSFTVYASEVEDFYFKGDYLFTKKRSSEGILQLFVSYKLGKAAKCVFNTDLIEKDYLIVDVTNNRALVAVGHSDTTYHLYVSENLDNREGEVSFTLSLEDVFCYFPDSTWRPPWIHHVSYEAFADVYKVKALSGIYIASKVLRKPGNEISFTSMGPQHLGSLITFDHGRSWRLIKAPSQDIKGRPIHCDISSNCSLHLTQRFNQLDSHMPLFSKIISNDLAPGIIMATGVLGTSLEGQYGVYFSNDAGLTWKQTLNGYYLCDMSKHGDLLVAVKYSKLPTTKHVLYSTDEGENWKQASLYDQGLKLFALEMEPKGPNTVSTMYASLPQKFQWIVIKLDFIKAFDRNCTDEDYKVWSPSQNDRSSTHIPFNLGRQWIYKRRIPQSNCHNDFDFNPVISKVPTSRV